MTGNPYYTADTKLSAQSQLHPFVYNSPPIPPFSKFHPLVSRIHPKGCMCTPVEKYWPRVCLIKIKHAIPKWDITKLYDEHNSIYVRYHYLINDFMVKVGDIKITHTPQSLEGRFTKHLLDLRTPYGTTGPIHTIPDSSHIRLLPISDRPSIRTILDESHMLRITFAEWHHSAVKGVCIGLLSISDQFWHSVNAWIQYIVAPEALTELHSALFSSVN